MRKKQVNFLKKNYLIRVWKVSLVLVTMHLFLNAKNSRSVGQIKLIL